MVRKSRTAPIRRREKDVVGQPVGVAPGPTSPTLRQRPRGWPTAPPGGVAAHRRRGTPLRTAPGPRTYDGWVSPIPPGTPVQRGIGVPPMPSPPQRYVAPTKPKVGPRVRPTAPAGTIGAHVEKPQKVKKRKK